MIKIRFIDNNKFILKYNGNKRDVFKYLTVITTKFIYCAVPIISEHGGWIFHYNKLQDVLNAFDNQVVYENEYIPPIYQDMGKNMLLQPYDYQKEAIYFALCTQEALLVLPCGAGKTPICVGIYLESKERNIIFGQGLILVKASLKVQWQKEISKFSNYNSNIIQTYSNRCSKWISKIKKIEKEMSKLKITDTARVELNNRLIELRQEADEYFVEQFDNQYDLLIANYETLLDEKVLECLIEKKIECIMCDEIHYAKSKDAERSKALYKLNSAKLKIGATATPITKDPRDVFGIYKFIKPDIFDSYSKFSRSYIDFAGWGKIKGFKNVDMLRDKISDYIFVKSKKDVASQLPKLNVLQLYCDLHISVLNKTQSMLEELEELNRQDFEIRRSCKSESEVILNEELQKISAKILALQTFCQEIADSPLLLLESDSDMAKGYAEGLNLKENPKMDLCLEKVQEILDSGEKVIIFSRYERMQGILTEAIKKNVGKDIKIAYVNGGLSPDKRYEEAYDKFKFNDEYKILLCSDAGAEGRFMPS